MTTSAAKETTAELADLQLDLITQLEAIHAASASLASIVAEYAPRELGSVLAGSGLKGGERRKAVARLRRLLPAEVFERLVARHRALSRPPYRLPEGAG